MIGSANAIPELPRATVSSRYEITKARKFLRRPFHHCRPYRRRRIQQADRLDRCWSPCPRVDLLQCCSLPGLHGQSSSSSTFPQSFLRSLVNPFTVTFSMLFNLSSSPTRIQMATSTADLATECGARPVPASRAVDALEPMPTETTRFSGARREWAIRSAPRYSADPVHNQNLKCWHWRMRYKEKRLG